jgi:hypothetical protein
MYQHFSRKFVVRGGVAIAALMAAAHILAAQEHQRDAALLAKLSSSKHSLADGVLQAEKLGGPAISAKFEMEGNQLMLSVYTAKQGRDRDAEHNSLMELIAPATTDTWKPKSEVFQDKAHIARSAMHLTVMPDAHVSGRHHQEGAVAADWDGVFGDPSGSERPCRGRRARRHTRRPDQARHD